MSEEGRDEHAAEAVSEPPVGNSPTHIANPRLRYEARRALVWASVIGGVVLAIYLAQTLMIIVGALVFATMIDGGARLLGRWLPIPRGWRVLIVMLCAIAFLVWLIWSTGSQISQQAAEFPALVTVQFARLIEFLQSKGFSVGQEEIQRVVGSVFSGVGTVTRAIGGIFGALTTGVLIAIIGLYLAVDPRPYERGVAWIVPEDEREDLARTFDAMAYTLRRLLAGRLAGMAFEGALTYIALKLLGVPMAALLAIITGLLAFIPNIGAIVSGVLMIMVGFSVSSEVGLWTIGVYFLVQNFDGYIVVPMIAKKTVDLAPALVLMSQLIFGVLFGIIGLALADPMLAMIKVWLERRAERIKEGGAVPESATSPA